jgi:hypothetical protein
MASRVTIGGILLLAGCGTDSGIKTFNAEPRAIITSHVDGDSEEEGLVFTLRGTVSDSDHSPDDLTATWYAGTEVLCAAAAPDGDGGATCDAVLNEDDAEIVLEVQDAMDGTGTARVNLIVITTDAPTAVITSPDGAGRFYADQRIDFAGIVSDMEDDPDDLDAVWTSDLDGDLGLLAIPDASGAVSATGFLSAGTHILTLTATDSSDKTGTDQLQLTVGPDNRAPSCVITAPEDGGASPAGELVVFEATVDDADVGPAELTVTWSSDKDDELGTSTPDSGGNISFGWSELSVATHTVSLTVVDEIGAGCTDTILFTVGDGPSVEITAPVSDSVYNDGDRVEFTATISDNEDLPHELDVRWESDLDGELSTARADSGGNLAFDTDALAVGTHTITLTVTDTDEMWGVDSIAVIVNGLPGAPGVDINPNPAYTADDLSVVIASESADPEGETIAYSYAWFVDGVPSAASTTATLAADATTKGQTWRVAVTPDDGTGTGESASAEREIWNTAPTLDAVSLSPTSPLAEDDITCVPGTAADDDGDSVSTGITWTIDGVLSATTGGTLSSAETASGVSVFCTATPNDGTEDGAPIDSDTVTIDNTAPSIVAVAIAPNPAVAGDELFCSYTGYSDPDDPDGSGDASTFSWSVDGALLGTEDTLSGDFVRGDEIRCTVTPFDGEAAGALVSATLTISNTAPSIGTVTILPDSATVEDVLVCTYDGFADVDGDADESTIDWTINGIAGGTGTLLAGGFVGGDEVICTVTPDDGFDGGIPQSAVVIIDNTGPELTSIVITPSTGIDTRTTLTCAATASDEDGDAPTITQVWTNDSEGTDLGTSAVLTLDPGAVSPGDTLSCTATATDAAGDTASDTASVTVGNTDPELDEVRVTPSAGVTTSTILSCSASATDEDGGTPTLSYAWTEDATGLDLGSDTTLTLTPDTSQPGDIIRCTVTATDADGGTDTGSDAVSVDNSAPEIVSVAITPDAGIDTTTTLVCAATATDADGDTPSLSYAWTNTRSGASLGTGDTVTLTPAASEPADIIECVVTATDADGDTDTDAASVAIDNTDPVITGVSISPSEAVDTGTTLTCTATATDVDGDDPTLDYAWTNETTGETLGTDTALTLTPSISSPGDAIACTVTARDAHGGFAVDADAIIVDNLDPVMSSVTITPDTGVDTQTELTCVATATDADEDPLTIALEWTNATTGATLGTDDTLTLTATIASPDDEIQCAATATDPSGGTDSQAASITVVNTDPEIHSVSIDPDSEVGTSDTLTCIVDVSDIDGDTPTIGYTWTNDTRETTLGTDAVLALTPETTGPDDQVRCAVVATDTDGGTAAGDVWLTIGNATPEITGVSIVPSTDVRSTTSLTCTATATDPDGDDLTLSYLWTNVDLGDVLGTGSTVDLDPAYAQPGDTIVCTATARDESGGTDAGTDSVVVENTAPVLTSVLVSPDTGVDTATTLTCSASGTDDDDEDGDSLSLSYAWTNTTEGTVLGTDASVTLTPTNSSPGDTITCTATVTDGEEDTDSDSAAVTVDNTAPTVTSVSIDPDSGIDTATSLTCTATATDADGDSPSLSYSWSNDTQGTDLGSGDTVTLTPSTSAPSDQISCAATAEDADGGTATDTATVTVENTDPEITAIVVSPSTSVDTSTELTCTVSASDADGGSPDITVVWTNDTDGSTLGVDTTVLLTPDTASPSDEISCTATATDEDGGADSDSDTITVENTAPEMGTVSITPDTSVTTATELSCSATVTDADGGSPTITYAWTNDTDGAALGSASTLTLTPTTSAPSDEISCTATATDADGGTDAGGATVTVDNTDPTLTAVSISPDSGVATDTVLTCSATATDADGDSPTFTFLWTNITVGAELGAEADLTLTAATSSPGDTIVCTATAADSDGGTVSDSAEVDVENTDPEVTSVTISPSTAVVTGTTLTCSATATDTDGGSPTFSYAWANTTEGLDLGAATSVTLTTANASPDDIIRCTATAADEDGGTGSDTATVTVENTDPEIATVAITPSIGVYTDTSLSCGVTATDADGDTPSSSFVWTNDTTGATIGTGAALDLDTAIAQPEHVLSCTATVTDSDGGSASDSASVTVENTTPSITGIDISPDSGVVTSTTLECSASAEDDDGDDPTLTYAWTNDTDGTDLGTDTAITLSTTTSSPGDVITCTATATDAHDGTGSDAASVIVDNTAPEVTGVTIDPETDVLTGTHLTCAGTATDDDGGSPTLSYAWRNTTTGTDLGTSATLAVTATNSDPGDSLRCTVTATDADEGTDTGSATVTVENTAPSIDSISISPSTDVTSSESLVCSVSVSDADGGTPSESYTWTNTDTDTTIGTDSALDLDPTLALPGHTVTCAVTVTDAEGDTDSDSASIVVQNTAPVITVVAIAPSAGVTTSEDLTCSATAEDVDGDTPALTYSWTNSTRGTALGVGAELTLTPVISAPSEEITCTVTATDVVGDTDVLAASVTVDNTNPEVTSITITPDTDVSTTTSLTCAATADDDDGGTPDLDYIWRNDTEGTVLATIATVTLNITNSSPEDEISCTATAKDDDGGRGSDTATVTVVNSEPEISDLEIIPDTDVTTLTDLRCSALVGDGDGDSPTVSYTWTNVTDGTTLGTETSVWLTPATAAPEDVIRCTVSATDSDGGSATDSVSVTVINSAPIIDSIAITPDSDLFVGTTLSCEVDAFDDDDEAVALVYAWTNDTEGSDLGSAEDMTLSSDNTSPGDIITCTVTATDGYDGETTDSASVTAENTDPALSGPTISPSSSVTTSTDLTCSATASDADGDDPTITYSWTNSTAGSTLGTESTVTLTTSTTSPEDTIVCAVTATDADGGTDIATDSVTLINQAPTISSVSISPDEVYTDDTITASVEVADADVDDVTVTYDWYVDGSPVSASGSTLSGTTYFDKNQNVYVIVTPDDGYDVGDSASSDALIILNTPPTAPSVSIDDSDSDLVCLIDTDSTDDDGDTISYDFSWTEDGTDFSDATSTIETGDTVDEGDVGYNNTWICTVTPNDGDEDGDFDTGTYENEVERGCGSLDFDGDDYVEISDTLDIYDKVTMEMWFKPDDWSNVPGWFGDWYMELCPSPYAGIAVQKYVVGSCDSIWDSDNWNHIAAAWDHTTGERKVWVNGTGASTLTAGGSLEDRGVIIGATDTSGTGGFDGQISELRLWNRILSNDEVAAFMETSPDVDEDGLIAEWEFYAGSGSTLGDITGNEHSGTINGASWTDTCAHGDADDDGFETWEDCDDDSAALTSDCGSRYWRLSQDSVTFSHAPRTGEIKFFADDVEQTVTSSMITSNGVCWAGSCSPSEPVPFGYANNCSDVGWIWDDGGAIEVDFGTEVHLTELHFWHVYDSERGAQWVVERSDDGSDWVTEATLLYESSSCGWSEFTW